eukprot:TRINITY_DN21125_c0_g1_i1.p1 TRINITY_DN21125_c0_g1~~TRINITY_DN21125_c0_g1_i1.p1  ORF type:complete len:397 (+),score=79.87 TRINITY_DN21125_c0_g1_i1:48-1193(+)
MGEATKAPAERTQTCGFGWFRAVRSAWRDWRLLRRGARSEEMRTHRFRRVRRALMARARRLLHPPSSAGGASARASRSTAAAGSETGGCAGAATCGRARSVHELRRLSAARLQPRVSRSSVSCASLSSSVSGFELRSDGDASDSFSGASCCNFAAGEDAASLPEVDELRIKLLRKLSYQNVWVPRARRPPASKTLIVFDWDDTLLCTSFVTSMRWWCPEGALLAQIAAAGRHVLELAKTLGEVVIITNADPGWVEQSALDFLPSILPVLANVPVISARGCQEAAVSHEELTDWKARAFLKLRDSHLLDESVLNLVSIGDADYEMIAAQKLGRACAATGAVVKTVKFKLRPSPKTLLRELRQLRESLVGIANHGRNLRMVWS